MTFYHLLLTTFIASSILGVYVYLKNPRHSVNASFALMIGFFGFWNLCIFCMEITPHQNQDLANLFGRLAFVFASMGIGMFLIVALVFPNPEESPISRNRLGWLMIPPIIISILFMTPLLVGRIYIDALKDSWERENGPLMFLFHVFASGSLLAAIGTILWKFWKTPGGMERARIRYAIVGMALTATLGGITNLVLPMMGNSALRAVGPPMMLITVGCFTYSIVHHRLMDITLAFRSLATFGILGSFFFILITGIMWMTRSFFPELEGLESYGTFILVVAFLTAPIATFGYLPVRKGMEGLIDSILFFRRKYDYQRDLLSFGRTLTTLLDLREVQNVVVKRVTELMHVSNTTLFLKSSRHNQYNRTAWWPRQSAVTSEKFLLENSPLLELLKRAGRTVIREELQRELSREDSPPVQEEMKRINCEAAVPLLSRDGLLGIISLGSKVSRDVFYTEDINLLSTLGNEVTIAIENATLHSRMVAMKEHTDNILQQMSSGVVTIDREGRILTVNKSAEQILDLAGEPIAGMDSSLLPEELDSMLQRTLRYRERLENEVLELSLNGNTIPLGISSAPLMGDDGEIAGSLVLFNDLSEPRRIEREMRRADRLATIGVLAAGLAHEIKNPLVSIRTFAQLLPAKYEQPEFRENFAHSMTQEVDRINSLVNHLLDLSRPSTPLVRPISLNELIRETLQIMNPELEEKKVTVQLKLDSELPLVTADWEHLKQVLINIILNAAQATDSTDSRQINILTWREPSGRAASINLLGYYVEDDQRESLFDPDNIGRPRVMVEVRDTGCGMDRESLARVFDPFFTTKESGSGLGLSIAKNVVLEQQGIIAVDSKPGAGTSFCLSFPETTARTRMEVAATIP